ncbi:DUF2852 domain-containing protein [uncultured Sulfitobacter sp.]|uniref:DUF2852 domain-containing protein n=1 Tax=uncultured Sulfitobacter sp. TaxID=191468 RepID=UPI0026375334|nr:DUF2852 domain-containing protein [uncultured Sulfitobacter sp.]
MATLTDTASYTSRTADVRNWLGKAQDWLDARGKPAWLAAIVLGFIIFWPVGVALLAFAIWSKRMSSSSSRSCARRSRHSFAMGRPTGNSAFDAYKADTLRRLEEEQDSFESFLARLRDAKDKTEFDAFMNERAKRSEGSAES